LTTSLPPKVSLPIACSAASKVTLALLMLSESSDRSSTPMIAPSGWNWKTASAEVASLYLKQPR
jgi:hypothetical protein